MNEPESFKSFLDQMQEGIQVLDFGYRYVYVNQAVADHGRTTREALLGRSMMECYPGIEHTSIFEKIRLCLEQRIPSRIGNVFQFPDGSTGDFQLHIQPIKEGVLITSVEVTNVTRELMELRDLNALLESKVEQRTARLRARTQELEQLAYVASHDLQEPLRTIHYHVEMLMEELQDTLSDSALDSLTAISGASVRMRTLIRALLDYGRLEQASKKELVALGALSSEVVADLAGVLTPTRAEVVVGPLPTLYVHRPLMHQLFQNLLSNAVKFRKPDVPPRITITATQEKDEWLFQVKDNGIGFDLRYRDRIFLMFQRLHSQDQYEGTGIGLAHCKKIVMLHGGQIWVDSSPGEGSKFSFTLPNVQPPTLQPPPPTLP